MNKTMRAGRLMTALLFVVALVGVTLSTAVAQVDEDDMEVRQRSEEFLFILGQDDLSRLEIEMHAGSGMNWLLSSGDRRIDFHMFSEEDGETTDHIGPINRTKGRSGTFTAPADDIYIITTQRDQEREARVRLTLEGEFGIQAMQGMEAATEVPGPTPVLILMGALAALAGARRLHRR